MRRLRIVGAVFTVMVMAVLYRAFTFQVTDREKWTVQVESIYRKRVPLNAQRGMIYDRNMTIMAMDIPVTSLAVDPSVIDDHESFCDSLGRILKEDPGRFRQLFEERMNSGFLPLYGDLSDEQIQRLKISLLKGLIYYKERKRVRPHGETALALLGITNADHAGVGGVEQTMNEILAGEDGWTIYQKDALNRNFASPDYPAAAPRDGCHLILTVNQIYQTIVEEEVRRSVIQHAAGSGQAVLMDPFSGEILAMASYQAPEKGGTQPFPQRLKNTTVQDAFEPGSIYKIVTTAAALEEEAFQPQTLVHCENGAFRLANHTIHDHEKAYSWLTLSQVLEVSSNIGMVKVGRKLGEKILYKYAQNFGFGTTTGIPLPGENSGILHPLYKWNDFTSAMVSFGQGISVTGLQMAAAMSAVVNGGELVKPLLVKSILESDGKEQRTFEWQVIRRVISENTSFQLVDMLEKVVLQGSGINACVDGIRVGGKTGTAQKSLPGYKGYYPGAYVASFVGFWPVEAPRFVLTVILDEPRIRYWGSESAAPLFSRIVSRIMGLPPSAVPEKDNKSLRGKAQFISLTEAGPAPAGKRENNVIADSPYHLPALVGLSVREALQKLAVLNVRARVDGNGVIVSQDPPAGHKINDETICRLKARSL